MSLGGGARTILHKSTLLGMNGFYDTSRLGGTWYSSGSLGLQMAALVGGNDAIDLNFNWYGKLFNSNVLVNAFRFGPSNFDFQAGYSHELWNDGPDFRLSATGYQFDIGNKVYGWNAGAELKSRDGMFVLRYNAGNDRVNQTYQTIGGFVNVGFQPENVLKGESPFSMPQPIFKSPRNLWYMLAQTVNRDWHQPSAAVVARAAPTGAPAPPGVTLPGYVALGTSFSHFPDFHTTSPAITTLPPTGTAVTFYWKGVQTTTTTAGILVSSGAGNFIVCMAITPTFTITAGDGQITLHVIGPSPPTQPEGISLGATLIPNPMTVDPGGGISVSW